MGELGNPLVVAEEGLYFASKTGDLVFLKTPRMEMVEVVDKKGKSTKKTRWAAGQREPLGVSWVTALLKAGNRIYAGSEKTLVAVDPSARAEIMALFPELLAGTGASAPARPIGKARKGRQLAKRHSQNHHELQSALTR